QGHAGRRPSGGPARAGQRRPQEQTRHQGVRGLGDSLQEHRLAFRAGRGLEVEGYRLMQQDATAQIARAEPPSDRLVAAFEHSITWEDDIWRADPVDVSEVHAKARRKFTDLLANITSGRSAGTQDRILLFHGQSGAGKTHLLRALRTTAHRGG